MRTNHCTFTPTPVDVSRKINQSRGQLNVLLALAADAHFSSLYSSFKLFFVQPWVQWCRVEVTIRGRETRAASPNRATRAAIRCVRAREHTTLCKYWHHSAGCCLQNPSYLSLTFRAALVTTSCIFYTSISFNESLQKGGNDFINLPQIWMAHWSNAIWAALKIKSRGAGFSLKWMELCADPHHFSTTYPVLLLTFATYLKLRRVYRKSANPQSAVAPLVLMAWSTESLRFATNLNVWIQHKHIDVLLKRNTTIVLKNV